MRSTNTRLINWLLLISYVFLLSILSWRHEMWRDELHTWTIVTHARTITELLYNKRYEGHPALWYVLLWPFSRLSNQPVVLQCVHGLLSSATASLVIFQSPFKLWEKAMLVWGYFLLYEYGVINRNYQIGLLLAFSLMAIWPLALRKPIIVGIGLALLFQTSAFGLLLGLGVGIAFLLNLLQTKQLIKTQVFAAVMIGFLGLVGAYWSIRTPPDLTYRVPFKWQWSWAQLQTALATVYQGLVPLPEIGSVNFWNTNILPNQVYQACLSVVCMLAVLWSIRRNLISVALFSVTALLILLFAYTSYAGSVRHNGHYMIALICSYWLYSRHERPDSRLPSLTFTVLLLIQGVASLNAAYMDGRYTFSMAKPLANHLKRNYPPDVIVAGSYNNLMTPVAGYLGRDVYTLSTDRYGSYVIWNEANWNVASLTMPDSVLFTKYLLFQQQHPNSVLVLAYPPFSHPPMQEGFIYKLRTTKKHYDFQCINAFQPAIIPDENYYIFRLKTDNNYIR